MSFDTLTLELQNILLVNHSYMSKWLVFLVMIFLSSYYIWEIWPNHKPTNYFTQAFLRIFFYSLSVVFLIVSPMSIINMSPELSFLDWYGLYYKFYWIITSIVFVLVFIDLISLGIFYVLAKAGLDVSNGRVTNIMESWENNKHFIKMKKNGGKFKFGR